MATTIRFLTDKDEWFLWDALYHAIHIGSHDEPPPCEILQKPDLARYIEDWMQRKSDLGVIAEVDGNPIGAAWLRCWSEDNKGYGFVDEKTPELSVSMLPDYRGKGIGSMLLRHLMSAAERRFKTISLSVSKTNPARRLYRCEGFESIGESKEGTVTMVKRLI